MILRCCTLSECRKFYTVCTNERNSNDSNIEHISCFVRVVAEWEGLSSPRKKNIQYWLNFAWSQMFEKFYIKRMEHIMRIKHKCIYHIPSIRAKSNPQPNQIQVSWTRWYLFFLSFCQFLFIFSFILFSVFGLQFEWYTLTNIEMPKWAFRPQSAKDAKYKNRK